jgi:hypothetical protein
MAYIVPKVLIQQEFTQIPVYAEFPLSAFILGPQYHLIRYNVEDEKEYAKVSNPTQPELTNLYLKDEDVIYTFPNIPAGGKADHSYTKVFFEDTVAKYFPNEDLGSVDLQSGADNVTLVSNSQGSLYTNRVRFGAPLTSDNGYTRSPWFSGRDVRKGDVVRLTNQDGIAVTSSIKAILPETAAQNSDLASKVGLAAAIRKNPLTPDGQLYQNSNRFTADSGNFTKDLEGEFLTVDGEINQTYKILAVVNSSELLLDQQAVEDESGLAWRIGGKWADINNAEGQVKSLDLSFESDVAGQTAGGWMPTLLTGKGISTFTHSAGTTVAGQENNVYTAVSGSTNGDGSGATFTVSRGSAAEIEEVTLVSAGSAYDVAEVITILGSSIGGTDGADDLEIAVSAVTMGLDEYIGYKHLRIINDIYTVELTNYSGDLDSARFTIYSNSGAFAPRQYRSLTNGILLVDGVKGNNLLLDFNGSTDWEIGKSVKIAAAAQVESAGLEASAPGVLGYTGNSELVYKLTVTRGGAFLNADKSNSDVAARVTVTSSGIDSSAAILVQKNQAFAVGSYGVLATFTAGSVGEGAEEGLVAGDIFYISARPAKLGPYTIIELAESLPPSYLYSATTPEIDLELFVKIPSVQIQSIRSIADNTANWTQLENYITVNAGATTTATGLMGADRPASLPVESAHIYVEHRDLLQDNVVSIGSVRSGGEIERKLGIIHPDNPLAQGVHDAVLNANNAVVYYIGVESADLSGYLAAIEIAKKTDKVYSFVPLTFDRTIQDAVVAHVNAYSTPEVGLWRIAWLAVEDNKQKALYTVKENGADWVGTITDDPQVPGDQFRLVTIPGATLIDDGIRATDSLRLNFRIGADGRLAYDEYVVDEVRTQNTLVLTTSLAAPLNSLTKIEIVRNYTRDERATNIAYTGGEFNNRRVRVVFPDEYSHGGIRKKGYFLAAALAGLRSGVVPHQGLTNTQVLGADDLDKIVNEFTQDQLNIMAEQGIWLVMQELAGATPFVRHQLTTDESGLNTSEDSITTNVDNISYGLKHVLAPYIGTYNINPENLLVVRSAIVSELTFRATGTRTVRAGNQLVSFTPKDDILLLQQNPNFKDRIDVEVRLNVPYPLNYINLKLIV